MKRIRYLFPAVVLLLVACADPILGPWEYDRGGTGLSTLTVHEGGDAGGIIYDELDGEPFSWIFDANWTSTGAKSYEFEMQHDGSLSGSDPITDTYTPSDFEFTMECQLERNDEELDCVGDGLFEEIALDWDRS